MRTAILLATALTATAGLAQAQSGYGCMGLESHPSLPAVEGRDGVIFPLEPDLYNFQPFSEEVADRIAHLSEALQGTQTRLIFAPIPTKAMAMPEYLTSAALSFGHKPDLAATIYDEMIGELTERGVAAVNVRAAIRNSREADMPFYPTDDRLAPAGAKAAAAAIAEAMKSDPVYGNLPKTARSVGLTGSAELPSAMRDQWQSHCRSELRRNLSPVFELQAGGGFGSVQGNLLGGPAAAGVALVGSDHSGHALSAFSAFLAQETGLEINQYSVEDGGAFAAISTYLTSDAFRQRPPAFLIWELPVSENLARFGDQPFMELAAATGASCMGDFGAAVDAGGRLAASNLPPFDGSGAPMMLLDAAGHEARAARFTFYDSAGLARKRSIYRSENQTPTGRFFLPLAGLMTPETVRVEVSMDVPFARAPRLTVCYQ